MMCLCGVFQGRVCGCTISAARYSPSVSARVLCSYRAPTVTSGTAGTRPQSARYHQVGTGTSPDRHMILTAPFHISPSYTFWAITCLLFDILCWKLHYMYHCYLYSHSQGQKIQSDVTKGMDFSHRPSIGVFDFFFFSFFIKDNVQEDLFLAIEIMNFFQSFKKKWL